MTRGIGRWAVARARLIVALGCAALVATALAVRLGMAGGQQGGQGRETFATIPVARPSTPSLPAGIVAPRLPSFKDSAWWAAATTVRHWPGRAGFGLTLDVHGRPSVAVFVYHQVAPAGWSLRNGPDYITPARLQAEFAFFRSHHVPTLTPAEFVAFLDGRGGVAPGSVFLTFDNGLEGVYRYAYPLARRYGVHFTVFLIGDRVHNRWQPGDRYMAWNQVLQMDRSRLVGVESETYDLHSLQTVARDHFGPALERQWQTWPQGHYVSLASYVHRLRHAFAEQRAVFWHHLHTTPTLLVWPFSTYNRVAEMEARAAGYVAAFAVYPGVITPGARPDRYALPRDPATFMWNDVPAEYEALRGGGLRLSWPPVNPGLIVAATIRGGDAQGAADRT